MCFKFVTCNFLLFSDEEIIGDQLTPTISVASTVASVVTNAVSVPVATSTTTSATLQGSWWPL